MTTSTQLALPYTGDPARTCPWCGTEEANDWILRNNHWVRSAEEQAAGGYDWCAEHGMCIAQDLARNHVAYALGVLARGGCEFHDGCCSQHPKYRPECAQARLERYLDRAAQLNVDVSDLLTPAGAA